jgi:hypothetical protein
LVLESAVRKRTYPAAQGPVQAAAVSPVDEPYVLIGHEVKVPEAATQKEP